jgi:NAD+ kinase
MGQGFVTIQDMNYEFSTVAIVGRVDDPRVTAPMRSLAEHLTKSGVHVIAGTDVANELGIDKSDEASLAARADLIVAVGGDGTILYAAEIARGHDKPVLGVNRGRLGFLADVLPDDMLDSIDRILGGDFLSESRLLLNAVITSEDGTTRRATALNDVVLQRKETGRMVDFETRIDGRYVNTHAGDGLIISTPTGSTAYSLSCGGPIIDPTLDIVALVPICPHTLSDRTIVIPASHDIDVVLLERGETKAEIIIDGRSIGELDPSDRLTVSSAEERITLIHPPDHDFYEILRSKLNWGRDSRQRQARDTQDT